MKELAIAHGVPASAIVLETKGDSTHTAAIRISQILAESGWRRVLLVSSPYHMRRALLTWRKSAPMVEVVPSPVADSQFYNHTAAGATLEQMRGIVHEYAAICAYWWRGWI